MSIEEALEYFGTMYRICKCLGIAQANGHNWKRQGYIPLYQQYRIEEITDGVLKADSVDPIAARKLEYLKNRNK